MDVSGAVAEVVQWCGAGEVVDGGDDVAGLHLPALVAVRVG